MLFSGAIGLSRNTPRDDKCDDQRLRRARPLFADQVIKRGGDFRAGRQPEDCQGADRRYRSWCSARRRGHRMNRRDFFILVGAATAAQAVGASAQESGKLYKIGIFFAGGPGEVTTLHDILRDDLRELGLIEGKNLVFEGRYADNRLDRLPALAAELVSLHADVIV